METGVSFQTSDKVDIQGAFFQGSDTAVVITHPHPLYGGDMDNIVVRTIAEAFQASGFTTLRFNFRGAGQSGGKYDSGNGEGRDVTGAAAYLEKQGLRRIHLAGYSFGAWVLAHVDTDALPAGNMFMAAPPAGFMDFGKARPCSRLKLAVTGSEDEIAPPGRVREAIARINPAAELKIIQGADHFFSAGIGELKAAVEAFLHI